MISKAQILFYSAAPDAGTLGGRPVCHVPEMRTAPVVYVVDPDSRAPRFNHIEVKPFSLLSGLFSLWTVEGDAMPRRLLPGKTPALPECALPGSSEVRFRNGRARIAATNTRNVA